MCVLPEVIEDRERRKLVIALGILADDCYDAGRAGQERAGLWEPLVRCVKEEVEKGAFSTPLSRLTLRDIIKHKGFFHRQARLLQVLRFARDFYRDQPWHIRQQRELVEAVLQQATDRISGISDIQPETF